MHKLSGRGFAMVYVVALGFLTSAGCATIVSGPTKDISFTSFPPGARVSVGSHSGITPVTIAIKRGTYGKVVFEKEGYCTAVMNMDRGHNYIIIGNIPFSWIGFIGVIIDIQNGAAYNPTPGSFFATLSPRAGVLPSEPALTPSVKLVTVRFGSVKIDCSTPDAEIHIDGRLVGNAPAILRLPAGAHRVELCKTGFGKCTRDITVSQDSQVTISAELNR